MSPKKNMPTPNVARQYTTNGSSDTKARPIQSRYCKNPPEGGRVSEISFRAGSGSDILHVDFSRFRHNTFHRDFVRHIDGAQLTLIRTCRAARSIYKDLDVVTLERLQYREWSRQD